MKIFVTVTPESQRAVRVKLDTARKGVAKGLHRGIQKAIISLESFYKKDILHGGIVKARTGNLSRSTFSRMLGEFTGVVGWGKEAPYARYVNDGTKPHIITATRAKALRFIVGGSVTFRKSVNHPGSVARNFAEIGLTRYTPNIREMIAAEVNRGVKTGE